MSCNGRPTFEYFERPTAVSTAVGHRWYHVLIVGVTQADLQASINAIKAAGGRLRGGASHCYGNSLALPALVTFPRDTNTDTIQQRLGVGSFAYFTTANNGLGPGGETASSFAGVAVNVTTAAVERGAIQAGYVAESIGASIRNAGSTAGTAIKVAATIAALFAAASLVKSLKS